MSEKFKVVISGVSGRFPECDRIDSFKEKLYNGEDFITVNDRKWPVGYRYKLNEKQIPDATGKLKNYQDLDNVVFKLKQATTLSTDITSKLAWESAFEAIIDAGVNPYSLDGCNVGVFMSLNFSEVSEHSFDDTGPICLLLGSNKTMLSNRLSFALNLTGPSFTNFLDVHGGLESLAMGYKYVSEGFADSAIVGASSCFKDPRISLHFIGPKLLSPDGRTRTFDEFADGYTRSDAVVCFYLQRAQEAKRSYGELKFCDIHYHGSNLSTLVGCDEKYLQLSLEEIYRRNNYLKNLSDVAYIEMNAYGFKKMDMVESNAIATFYDRTVDCPLMIGSIKSNVGHTEGAAGLMAVVKAILTLDSGMVAPNLHLSKINPDVQSLVQKKLKVVQETTKLNGHTIAVNSLGLSGSVGHAVIQKNPNDFVPKTDEKDELPRLLLVSGRVENDLRQVIKKIGTVPYSPEFVALVNDSLGQYLPLHLYRGYTILPTNLQTISDVEIRGAENRPIWFIFSGMGSQWHGMGHSLLDLPVFAETVAKCDQILRPKGIDIYRILTSEEPTLFESIINAFIALYEVLRALGIKPDGIIGHSHGENSCAYADGCLSLEETILAAWTRGLHSIEMDTIKGMMAAVGKGYHDIKDSLADGVEVACHNSAQSCTLSGPADKVNAFVSQLKNEGTFAKAVDVANIAYHSSYIASTGPQLISRLKEVIRTPKQRSAKWISTSVPENEWSSELAQFCSAEYLTNNFVNPVLFEEGCKHIPENAVCIELAPHGLLQAILKKSLPDTCTNVPLTYRSKTKDNLNFLLTALGKLYLAGLEIRANNIYPRVNYPVPRGTPSISPFCTWYHDPADVLPRFLLPNLFCPLSNESISINIKEDSEYAYLRDHKVNNDTLIPPSFFMYLTWWIFSYQRKEKLGSTAVVFEDIVVKEHVTISLQSSISVLIMVQHGTGDFEVILDDASPKPNSPKPTILMTGSISTVTGLKKTTDNCNPNQMSLLLKKDQLYKAFEHSGYHLDEAFNLLQNVYRRESDYYGEILWTGNWVTFIDSLMKFQMIAHHRGEVDTLYPTRIRQLKIPDTESTSLEKGKVLTCKFSPATRTLQCIGIEMCHLHYESIIANRKNYKVMQYRFVPYANPKCQNIFEFISLCLQIAEESLSMLKTDGNELRIIKASNNSRCSLVVEHIINCQSGRKSSIVLQSTSDCFLRSKSHNESLLIISDTLEGAQEFDLSENVFILAISPFTFNSDFKIQERYIEVTKQSFLGCTFSLLQKKRSQHVKPVILFDNDGVRNGNGVHSNNGMVDNEDDVCFFVRQNIELGDLSTILAMKKYYSKRRYIYLIDAETDIQELKKSIELQVELRLPVMVLKQGEWGSYRNLSFSTPELNEESLHSKVVSSLSNFDFGFHDDSSYVSVHSEFVHVLNQDPVLGFAYTGSRSPSEKIAGLGKTTISGCPECDPYLLWRVPREWSSEDAVTVPYIYAQAYNLFYPPMYRSKEIKSALINMGKDCMLTEAFITLALHKKLTKLFVTVTSDGEIELIRKKFPELQPSQILLHENQSYELQINLLTKGEGVDLVVNCLPGIENVEASLSCVSFQGYYIDVGKQNCDPSNKLGLHAFLKSVSFFVIQNNVTDLLKLPCAVKKRLNIFIQECIDKGVIIPPRIRQLQTKTQSTIHEHFKLVKCVPSKNPPYSTSLTVKYDDKHSYIVIGEKANHCLEVLEWLAVRGARKFIVCLQTLPRASEIPGRITRLREQTKAILVLTSLAKLDEIESAKQLYEETRKIAPLEAIFFVSIQGVSEQFSNLDAVVASTVHFIGISSGRLNDYERRRSRNSPAILIHGDDLENSSTLLPHLDDISALDRNDAPLLLYKVVNQDFSAKRSEKKRFPLREYFPSDICSLIRVAQDSNKDTNFIEVLSLSRKYRDCKGVYPIFVLPAFHKESLQPLYQRLLYPVFSAINVNIASVSITALTYFALFELRSLNLIQPSGPVTLISEMWNLPIALEIMAHVERSGRTFKVFALEGNPQDWKKRVLHLGSTKSPQFDQRIMKDIFHFDPKVRSCHVRDGASFEDRVIAYIAGVSKDNETVNNVVEAAKIKRQNIYNISRLQFNSRVLNNIIFFERTPPDYESLKLSITSDVVVLEESTYKNLIIHPKACKIINENAAFNWWEFPKNEPKKEVFIASPVGAILRIDEKCKRNSENSNTPCSEIRILYIDPRRASKRSSLDSIHARKYKGAKPKGVICRNKALKWIRENAHDGVLYFADDDNTYDIDLFSEIRSTKKVAMWPVGLVTQTGVSTPVVRDGKFVGFYDGWIGGRKFPVDMAGFAVNIEFLRQRPTAQMAYRVGYEEDSFLKSLAPFEPVEIELKADNCTKVLVWHTQAKKNAPSQPLDTVKFASTNLIDLKKTIV